MTAKNDRLSLPRVLAFAGVGMPLAAVGLPMSVFVAPMYAKELGLGTALTGIIFMCLRFWDLGTDPIMGWLVDTKPSRFGRVKHWLVLAVPVLMLAAYFLYMPAAETATPLYLAIWLGVL
jgi:Na+/melibiose symporter-like transporter